MLQLLEKVYSTSVEKLLPQKTVKLQFCSDIHVEFGTEGFLKPEAPFLALLGDIGLTAESDYRTYLLKQSEKFEKVFVIAGNHEFYNVKFLFFKKNKERNLTHFKLEFNRTNN